MWSSINAVTEEILYVFTSKNLFLSIRIYPRF